MPKISRHGSATESELKESAGDFHEVANSCLDARPPGIAKQSATTEFDIAVSFGGAVPSLSRAKGRSNAVDTAVARPADKARTPGIAKKSATTEFDIAVSSDEARLPGIEKWSATTDSDIAAFFGGAVPSQPKASCRNSAGIGAVAMPAGEAQPPGNAKQSGTTKPELGGSSGGADSHGSKVGGMTCAAVAAAFFDFFHFSLLSLFSPRFFRKKSTFQIFSFESFFLIVSFVHSSVKNIFCQLMAHNSSCFQRTP